MLRFLGAMLSLAVFNGSQSTIKNSVPDLDSMLQQTKSCFNCTLPDNARKNKVIFSTQTFQYRKLKEDYSLIYIKERSGNFYIRTARKGRPGAIMAVNKKGGWSIISNKPRKIMPTKQYNHVRISENLQLKDFKKTFASVILANKTDIIDNKKCFKLTCTPPPELGLKPIEFWLDAKSLLLRQQKSFLYNAKTGGGSKVIKRFSDYRRSGSGREPMTMQIRFGNFIITNKIDQIIYDAKLPPELFIVPKNQQEYLKLNRAFDQLEQSINH